LLVGVSCNAPLLFLLSLNLSCHQPPVNKPWQITLPDWSKAVGVVGAPDEVDSSTKFTKQHVKIKYGLDGVFFVMPPEQFVPTQQAGGAGGIAGLAGMMGGGGGAGAAGGLGGLGGLGMLGGMQQQQQQQPAGLGGLGMLGGMQQQQQQQGGGFPFR
jgi:hypothetical protein